MEKLTGGCEPELFVQRHGPTPRLDRYAADPKSEGMLGCGIDER